jgi:UDP-2-acetamido-3-amino-2,3-dideoxy-glucuronate N-acetyltransferase
MDNPAVQQTADVDSSVLLGPGTTVWHLAQIRENARLGRGCIVGRGAYIGPGVIIGDHVKLQNYALVYEPARLEDGVFIGPAAVLTNDPYPRSVDLNGKLKRSADWNARGVLVQSGASLGARVVVVAGCTIGRWALVAAGAVVTKDVPDFALVVGVPARQVGWVGRAGKRLAECGGGRWRCPQTGEVYGEQDGALIPLTSDGHFTPSCGLAQCAAPHLSLARSSPLKAWTMPNLSCLQRRSRASSRRTSTRSDRHMQESGSGRP